MLYFIMNIHQRPVAVSFLYIKVNSVTGESMTYTDLWKAVMNTGSALIKMGVKKGIQT